MSMQEQSNIEDYLKVSKKGVILKYTNIRALPTSRPLLKDPSLAGEGFPFDYLQNSAVNANIPVFISHYSKDKQWVFIFTRFTYGWVKNEDVVVVNDAYTDTWKKAKQIYIIKEGIPLFTQSGEALFNTRIGMLFALIEEDATDYTVLSVSKYKNNEAMFHKTKIAKTSATINPLALNKENLNNIINEVSKTNYGWGGVYEQRDCSSTLMDLYAPFGLALPRNSSKQKEIGLVIDLSTLNNSDKLKTIKEKAIPFETLLYKKGHIVLYVGVYKDDVIVFHNTWGIKTKDAEKEGRFIIGKAIFSTLTIGSELKNYDESAELLRNIKSMNILTR
ncbi:MAG: SH3 domain-containing protein [Sulfurimonas sp.]|nr:SH3 domain-containing protein [Sulfurimonas sp.]